jgi:hypothetical protein
MSSLVLKMILMLVMSAYTGFRRPVDPQYTLQSELNPFVKSYDLKQIDLVLNEIKSKKRFPEYANHVALTKRLPQSVIRRARELNRVLFDRPDVIKIYGIEGDHSSMHQPGRSLAFPVDLIETTKNNPAVLDYTLAHAMAHYIYELHIENLNHGSLSAYGNPSRKEGGSNSETLVSAAAHAEIDAYATAILIKLGRDPVEVGNIVVGTLLKSKKLIDRFIGMQVTEFTALSRIPDDYRARIQDNYVRMRSIENTLYHSSQL